MNLNPEESELAQIDERFEVVMSTYNGARFLSEQLRSLESQKVPGLFLRIRDDGSQDDTGRILENFACKKSWVRLTRGCNIGVVGSFFTLLNSVSENAAWVAFCDQDDVWDQDKLARARLALLESPPEVPAMYFSGVRLVDKNRQSIGSRTSYPCNPSFSNALVQNVATGCTVVLNQGAIRLLKNRDLNIRNIPMHDWWVYLVISAFGRVLYDPLPSMDYRQHENNVIGSRRGYSLFVARIKRFVKRERLILVNLASEFMRVYGKDVPEENRRICEAFARDAGSESVFDRLLYVLNTPLKRQRASETILMKMLIVCGWR